MADQKKRDTEDEQIGQTTSEEVTEAADDPNDEFEDADDEEEDEDTDDLTGETI